MKVTDTLEITVNMRCWGCGVLATLVSACGTVPVEGEIATVDSARLEYRIAGMAGAWLVEIDSASGVFQSRCEPARGLTCSQPVKSGTLPRARVDGLFADVATPEFRQIKAEYDMSATYVDGPAYSVSVSANGKARSIRWSDAEKQLPPALSRLVSTISTATGTAR